MNFRLAVDLSSAASVSLCILTGALDSAIYSAASF